MEQEIFKAGVRPGSPTTNDEIKMLVCYILSKTARPMRFAQLHEALEEDGLVNYFELTAAVDMLLGTGHIKPLGEDATGKAPAYAVTGLGMDAAAEFKNFLPASVRDKAVQAADKLLRREKRESEVSVRIAKRESGGFEVALALPENGGNLLSFSVFCPTREESEVIRRRFLNDPAYIYKGVLALLTGDKEVIGEMFPEKEKLF